MKLNYADKKLMIKLGMKPVARHGIAALVWTITFMYALATFFMLLTYIYDGNHPDPFYVMLVTAFLIGTGWKTASYGGKKNK